MDTICSKQFSACLTVPLWSTFCDTVATKILLFVILVDIVHLFKIDIPLTNFECLYQHQVQHLLLLLWYGGRMLQGGYWGDIGDEADKCL